MKRILILTLLGFPLSLDAQTAHVPPQEPQKSIHQMEAETHDPTPVFQAWEDALGKIKNYECTLVSEVWKGDKKEYKVYEYHYVHPDFVKMKVIKGDSKGGEAFYDPTSGKVRARKTGLLSVVRLTLDPTDKKVTSIRGHKITETSFFYYFNKWKNYTTYANVYRDTLDNGHVVLVAEGLKTEENYGAVKATLEFDPKTWLPVKLEEYDADGKLIHRVMYKDVRINTGETPEDLRF
jgi:hypothetical protein